MKSSKAPYNCKLTRELVSREVALAQRKEFDLESDISNEYRIKNGINPHLIE